MSRLSELRNRAQQTKKSLQQQKAMRIKESVLETVKSDSFNLSVLDAAADKPEDGGTVQEFAEAVAANVADAIMNPVNDFLDTCKARGLSERKIRVAVEDINRLFGLTESDKYEERLEAVALYMWDNKPMYDTISSFTPQT